ncbi:MAG: hypothetical protein IT430_06075 [Phycisphaerales bacterium]|nr:hypothetical protein [Phycisphaerales bacterium]
MTEQSTSQNPEAYDVCLCEADCVLLDALMECNFDPGQFEGPDRARAERLLEILGLVHQYPDEPIDEHRLVAATMLRIDQYERSRRVPALAIEGGDHSPGLWFLGSFNWRTSLAAAAAILILVSVTVPMLANMRRSAIQQACFGGLGQIASALSSYASTSDGSLPIRMASAPNGNWLESRANSSNLFHLAKAGFIDFDGLACPGNPFAESEVVLRELDNWPSARATSFSFQNMLAGARPRWNTAPTMVILADKSPLVEAARDGRQISVDALSPSHRRGQNALLSDGSAMWLDSAQFGNDNIWVPDPCRSKRTLFIGTEMPGGEYDSMLIH